MNSTTYMTKSMNGITDVGDGILSIENGVITFGDGTVLDTSEDITFKSLDNTLTGDNTFTGTNYFDNNIFSLALAPEFDSQLTRKDYVDMSIANETTRLLAVDNIFTGSNTFNNPIIAPVSAPLLSTHLTNKSYVDGAIATETASILASDNTFTGDNTFSKSLSTTGISNNGTLSVSGTSTVAKIISSEGVAIPNDFTGLAYVEQGESAYEGMFQGNGDGVSSSIQNLKFKSWNSIGFIYSNTDPLANPTQEASIYMGVRTGTIVCNDLILKTTLDVSGTSLFKSQITSNDDIYLKTNSLKFGNGLGKYITYSGDDLGGTIYDGITNGLVINGWVDGGLTTSSGGDKTTLYWNNASQVGINTTTPSYNLDVAGTGRFTDDVFITATTPSTLSTDGALVVSGGVGIAEKLNVGSDLTVLTNAYVGGIVLKSVIATPIQTGSSSYAYFTSNSLLVSSVSSGYEYALSNGVPYEVIYSTIFNTSYNGYKMFNNDLLDPFVSNAWACGSGKYSTTTGLYTASVSTTTDLGVVLGEYNQIKLPYPLKLTSFDITNVVSTIIGRAKNFVLLGSNDGTTWITILSSLVPTGSINVVSNFTTTNNTFYFYFRIIVKDIYNTAGASSYCGIEELKLYGEAYSTYIQGITSNVFNSILQINGDVGIYNNLYVDGNTELTNNLTVNGTTTLSGTLTTGEITNDTINGVRVKAGITNNQYTIVVDDGSSDLTNLLNSGMENFIFGKLNMGSYTGTGTQNIAVGLQNLGQLTTGGYNTVVGCNLLQKATSQFNTAIGNNLCKETTTGGYNVGIGYNSFNENTSGRENVSIGYLSGRFSTGSFNTFLGTGTKTNNSASYDRSTAVGYIAEITDSDQIVLGRDAVATYVSIPSTKASVGTGSGALVVNGGVGIAGALNVGGTATITGETRITDVLKCGRNIGSGSITIENNRCHIGWNVTGGTAEVDFINGVPTTGYETGGAGFRFYNKTSGATFSSTNQSEHMLSTNPIQTHITPATQSTSITSGALRVNGGAGIAKNVVVGGMIRTLDNTYNKKIVLQDAGTSDDPEIATAFFGFGVNTSTLRYQTHTEGQYHRFYNGNDLNLEVGNKAVNVKESLKINDQELYFKASTGINKALKTPLYVWSFTATTNLTKTLVLSTAGLSNYLGYPFEIRVMFHPTGVTYPVYNITNQSFNFGYDNGWQISYPDGETAKLRTGDLNVALIYNHTTNTYQAYNSGTYFVYFYA